MLCFTKERVTAADVRRALGLIPQERFFTLDRSFADGHVAYAFELTEILDSEGKDLAHVFTQLIEHVRTHLLVKTIGEKELKLPEHLFSQYIQSAKLYTNAQLLYLFDYLLKIEQQIHQSGSPRIYFEAALLHYIQSKHRIPVEVLVRQLTELKEKIEKKRSQQEESIQPPPSETKQTIDTHVSKGGQSVTSNFANQKAANMKLHIGNERFTKDDVTNCPDMPQECEKGGVTPKENLIEPEQSITLTPPVPPSNDTTSITLTKLGEKKGSKQPLAEPTRHHPSHYETLIRFAAVELEGTKEH
jgi:DNA polymerase III gamma/tau subunit